MEEFSEQPEGKPAFFCPNCAQEIIDPLVCGDCLALICRRCGTPLERAEELGVG